MYFLLCKFEFFYSFVVPITKFDDKMSF